MYVTKAIMILSKSFVADIPSWERKLQHVDKSNYDLRNTTILFV